MSHKPPPDPTTGKKPLTLRRLAWRICRGVLLAVVLLAVAGTALGWYMLSMPGQGWEGALPALTERQKSLSAQLRADVALFCTLDGRSTRLPKGLDQAAGMIEGRLRELGYDVSMQSYEADKHQCANIIAERQGTARADQIVVIGAHYDLVQLIQAGADDNTSGVAALLALAQELKDWQPQRTVRLVFFTNEEPPFYHTPLMGSMVYAQSCRQKNENIVEVMVFDGLGYYSDVPGSQHYPPPFSYLYPDTANFIGFAGDLRSRTSLRKAVKTFRDNVSFPSEGIAAPQLTPGMDMSDHWSFWQYDYPGFLVTDTLPFRYKYYHSGGDSPEKLDYEKMARVVDGLIAITRKMGEE